MNNVEKRKEIFRELLIKICKDFNINNYEEIIEKFLLNKKLK